MGNVTLVDQNGIAKTVDASEAPGLVAQGFRVESATEHAARVGDAARAAGTDPIEAAQWGAATGISGGLTDVAARLIGGEDAASRLRQIKEANPIANTLGNVAGAIGGVAVGAGPASWAARAGAATTEAAGGGLLARGLGGAVEGGIFGAGQGVSDLALSNDPLTAEHVSSVLSTNVLLGAGIGGVTSVGTKLLERGLQIAGDKLATATAARETLQSLPADLQSLDDAGLKDALAAAKADHAADIAAERQSLEGIRVNQRAELANQVQDLHADLATERPIFTALSEGNELTPALKGIDGVADARVQMAKSYERLRSAFDNPLAVQRDPMRLIDPLEQRQGALEALQEKLPELHAALAGDSRAAVLEHVDTALEETKQQISAIRAVGRATGGVTRDVPVSSGRLMAMEAGPSARMQAIEAARDALKQAPELGLVGKGASSAAFAGGTALAHMIPGVGLAAPFVGKAAANAVETLFKRGASVIGTVADKAPSIAAKFLGSAKALEPYVAPTATKVLSAVRFGASKGEQPAEDDLAALHRARTSELYAQTARAPDGTTVMRPDARAAMAKKLDPIRQVNPVLADKVETNKAREISYLASIAPKLPDPPALQIGPDKSRAADLAIRSWARSVRAAEDPASVEERLARGICTPEEAQAYQVCHPERFAALQKEIFEKAPLLEKTLPMSKKVALSVFTGIPVTPAMQPNVLAVLQSTFAVEPGSAGGTTAPRPQPNYGHKGSLKDVDKPTPSQEREMNP